MSGPGREAPWAWIHAAGCTIALAGAAIAWTIGVQPILAARQERASLESRLREARSVLDELDGLERSLDDRLEASQRWLDERGLAFDGAERSSSRLVVLADLAEAAGLRLDRLLPDEARAQERYDVILIRVGGSGSDAAIEAFMGAVQETWRDMGVRRLALTARESSTPARSVGFEMELAWFIARPDEVAAASP